MTKCKKCNREIEFRKNESGKWYPVDKNGVNHFETCPHAAEFRNKYKQKELKVEPKKQKTLEEF